MGFDIQTPEGKEGQVDPSLIPQPESKISLPVDGGVPFRTNPDYHKMADFLGLKNEDRLDEEVAQKISYIRDFTKADNEIEAMVKIKEIKRMLGEPTQGKLLVNKLYQYVRLSGQKEMIEKEMSLLVDQYYGKENGERTTAVGSLGA